MDLSTSKLSKLKEKPPVPDLGTYACNGFQVSPEALTPDQWLKLVETAIGTVKSRLKYFAGFRSCNELFTVLPTSIPGGRDYVSIHAQILWDGGESFSTGGNTFQPKYRLYLTRDGEFLVCVSYPPTPRERVREHIMEPDLSWFLGEFPDLGHKIVTALDQLITQTLADMETRQAAMRGLQINLKILCSRLKAQ